jgi:hypothetical protein
VTEQEATVVRRPWLVYTVLRLAVFLGVAAFLALLGMNGFPLLVVALFLSMLISVFALRRQRAAVVAAQLARRERRTADRGRLDQA